jgi:hypothetical protein
MCDKKNLNLTYCNVQKITLAACEADHQVSEYSLSRGTRIYSKDQKYIQE